VQARQQVAGAGQLADGAGERVRGFLQKVGQLAELERELVGGGVGRPVGGGEPRQDLGRAR
jgi:hypothetical protein